jgi:hypothetical protein
MWKALYIWVAKLLKVEGPRRTRHKESKKQLVLLYNTTQYGQTTIYLLGTLRTFRSNLSQCYYMVPRYGMLQKLQSQSYECLLIAAFEES